MRRWVKRAGLAALVLLLASQLVPVSPAQSCGRSVRDDLLYRKSASNGESCLRAVLQELSFEPNLLALV